MSSTLHGNNGTCPPRSASGHNFVVRKGTLHEQRVRVRTGVPGVPASAISPLSRAAFGPGATGSPSISSHYSAFVLSDRLSRRLLCDLQTCMIATKKQCVGMKTQTDFAFLPRATVEAEPSLEPRRPPASIGHQSGDTTVVRSATRSRCDITSRSAPG